MKEILEKIYKILMRIYLKSNNPETNSYLIEKSNQYLERELTELKKLIDALEEAELTDGERKAAEEIIGRCE